jgi:hypothetical protein
MVQLAHAGAATGLFTGQGVQDLNTLLGAALATCDCRWRCRNAPGGAVIASAVALVATSLGVLKSLVRHVDPRWFGERRCTLGFIRWRHHKYLAF